MTTSTNGATWLMSQADVESALRTLENGGIILFPTDTVWSLGCDPENTDTVQRLLRLVRRSDASGAEVLVPSLEALKQLVNRLHPRLETLLYFHQRPLTVLVDTPQRLPHTILTPEGQIAIRIVQDAFCKHLLETFAKPVFSVFAGIAGQPYPTSFGNISSEIIQGCNHVVRYRQMERNAGMPSVMVRLSEVDEELEFLRE
ncbi:MAG: Sua5/YciO/YrdC/YwlC family protein [Saprospiraceae bacterium]|nr:Sua5/YciO/YrdC/YwlC family protein [Saprospiraceae bacterium]